MSDTAETAFSAAQFAALYPPGIERHWWMLARIRIVDRLLRTGAGIAGPMLEVGCGTGVMVAGLRALGHDCRGVELADVEPVPLAHAYVRRACDALDLPEQERITVRSILLLDVLEHLDDPVGFLARLAPGFPALQQVIVSVPARRELWSNHDEFNGHRLRYDLASLRGVGTALGWRADRVGYAFRLPYLPAWIMARLGIPRAVQLRAPGGATKRIHSLIAALAVLEWRLLPAQVPGSSAVARFHLP